MTVALQWTAGDPLSSLPTLGAAAAPAPTTHERRPPPTGAPGARSTACSIAGLVVSLAATMLAGAAHAQPDESAARKAAQEIAAAQDRANEAARQWSEAEAELTRLEDEAAQLEQERAMLQAQVDDLRSHRRSSRRRAVHGVRQRAASRSSPATSSRWTSCARPSWAASPPARPTTPSTSSTSPSATSQRKADALAAKQDEVAAQRVRYEELAAKANEEVEHLQQVEQQRLADEQVRLALEAQRARGAAPARRAAGRRGGAAAPPRRRAGRPPNRPRPPPRRARPSRTRPPRPRRPGRGGAGRQRRRPGSGTDRLADRGDERARAATTSAAAGQPIARRPGQPGHALSGPGPDRLQRHVGRRPLPADATTRAST